MNGQTPVLRGQVAAFQQGHLGFGLQAIAQHVEHIGAETFKGRGGYALSGLSDHMVQRQQHANRFAGIGGQNAAIIFDDEQVVQVVALGHLGQHPLDIRGLTAAAQQCAHALAAHQLAELVAGFPACLLQVAAAGTQLAAQVGQQHLLSPAAAQDAQRRHDQRECQQQRHQAQRQQPKPQGAVPGSSPPIQPPLPVDNKVFIFRRKGRNIVQVFHVQTGGECLTGAIVGVIGYISDHP